MNYDKEKNFISAVIYVYNNADRIGSFFNDVGNALLERFEKIELIFVNDASTDNSAEVIESCAREMNCTVTTVNMSYHQGIELSLNAGVDLAIGDYVYEFESPCIDGSPNVVNEAYDKAMEGYDIVAAVPDGKHRKSSALFYRIYNSFSNTQYKLQTETFRILSRRAINRVKSMTKTIPFRKAVYANCGLRKADIAYTSAKNLQSRDKQQKKDYRLTATDSLILYTDLAYKGCMLLSFLMMIVMLAAVGYTVAVYAYGNTVSGWSSTIIFLSFGFLGLFAILTMIIKYLSILLKLNFKRMDYVIESIEKKK